MDRVQVLLQEKFYWPKLSEDVRIVIRSCERCLRFKQKPQQDEMYPITASYPLELIHLDFLTIGGKDDVLKHILVITDHFTRYAQCYVTSNQTATTVADKVVNEYFTNYGWPDKILTDRGTSFENILFKEICDLVKVKKLRTSSYHPQTKKNWQEWVPTLVHAYNCTTSSVTGFSPYFLIYGRQPKLPIDIEYGVTLPDSYSDCKTYADKLERRLQWPHNVSRHQF